MIQIIFLIISFIIILNRKNIEKFDVIKKTSNNLFDKIYVINLEESKDRLENLNKQANKLNLNIERFPAIKGKTLTEQDLINNDYLGNIKLKYNGSLGCYLSHCLLWEKIYKENKYDNVLILEDDCLLPDNFIEQIQELKKYTPEDFDYLNLGIGKRREGKSINNKLIIPIEKNEKGLNAGLFGYIIKRKNIPKLLSLVKPINNNIYIDTVLRSNFNKLNVFFVKKNIIGHNFDIKSIRNTT